jgi:hypothetical protein
MICNILLSFSIVPVIGEKYLYLHFSCKSSSEGIVNISYHCVSYLADLLSHQDFGAHMTGSQNGQYSLGERDISMALLDSVFKNSE